MLNIGQVTAKTAAQRTGKGWKPSDTASSLLNEDEADGWKDEPLVRHLDILVTKET